MPIEYDLGVDLPCTIQLADGKRIQIVGTQELGGETQILIKFTQEPVEEECPSL